MPAALLLFAAFVTAADGVSHDGCIGGVVINSSRGAQPVAGARVVLEMKSDEDFVLLDETTTDAAGRFLFRNLPVSQYIQYKPSAQFEGIHYPGPRVHLARERNTAAVTLTVRDVVLEPNPLHVRNHEINIRSATGMLEVTESLAVENPSQKTYVGTVSGDEGAEPVTLQLSIPADFQKVTFHDEFFGRSFAIRGGRLVTSIPWEPGQRVVKFTYYLRNTRKRKVWERTLDLPTEDLQVRIVASAPDHLTANLHRVATTRNASDWEVLFTSGSMPTAGPARRAVHVGCVTRAMDGVRQVVCRAGLVGPDHLRQHRPPPAPHCCNATRCRRGSRRRVHTPANAIISGGETPRQQTLTAGCLRVLRPPLVSV